jgi:CubicO group peptidase (beta-lactamase class C family)
MASALVLAVLAGACTADDPATTAVEGREPTIEAGPSATYPSVPLATLDQQLRERVDVAGLDGAALLVEQDGSRLHTFTTGTVTPSSEVPLAESGTWLTAAVLMTLVDEGLVGLDDPVAEHLPFMRDGAKAGITLRQLLSHTSGLPRTVPCTDAEGCDLAVAEAPLLTEPGSAFAVSAVGYHVAARLAEAVTDRTWSTLVTERLLEPLGMGATRFRDPADPGAGPASTDPEVALDTPSDQGLLAADGVTTADDLGRFLTMVLARGETAGGRVLTASSVEEMERDQTPSLDTSSEPWVAATGIPTYGLGVWRDRLRGDGTRLASMVSAPNRSGLYPLIDRTRNAWAVVAVDDEPLAPFQAVRDSAGVAQLMAVAIDTDGRPIREPGSTIPR